MRSTPLRDWERYPGSIGDFATVQDYLKARALWVQEQKETRKAKREFDKLKKGPRGNMAVHKSDRAAVRKLLAKNKQIAKRRAAIVKRVLALRAKANTINLEANGLMVSADELEREINSNDAAIRGYSFGG